MRLRISAALLACLSLLLCAGCDLLFPGPDELTAITRGDFFGAWKNVDSDTGGCTRFEIYEDDQAQLMFQGYGACHPTDCVWAPVPMTMFSDSVSDDVEKYGLWIRGDGFADRVGILEFVGSRLQLTLFTVFTDESGRSNYRSIDLFRRAP